MAKTKHVGDDDIYGEPVVFKFESGVVCNVYHPINLTPEERARRMKEIHDAAAHLLRERYKRLALEGKKE